jgi:hypothetical protein
MNENHDQPIFPKFDKNLNSFQIDLCPEELHNSRKAEVGLHADVGGTVRMINLLLKDWAFPDSSEWWTGKEQT